MSNQDDLSDDLSDDEFERMFNKMEKEVEEEQKKQNDLLKEMSKKTDKMVVEMNNLDISSQKVEESNIPIVEDEFHENGEFKILKSHIQIPTWTAKRQEHSAIYFLYNGIKMSIVREGGFIYFWSRNRWTPLNYFRTKLCKFNRNNRCKVGKRCLNAHSESEKMPHYTNKDNNSKRSKLILTIKKHFADELRPKNK